MNTVEHWFEIHSDLEMDFATLSFSLVSKGNLFVFMVIIKRITIIRAKYSTKHIIVEYSEPIQKEKSVYITEIARTERRFAIYARRYSLS